MSDTLIEKAASVAELMTLSITVGVAAEVKDSGEVFLTTPGSCRPKRIGRSVRDAVLYLRKLSGETGGVSLDATST